MLLPLWNSTHNIRLLMRPCGGGRNASSLPCFQRSRDRCIDLKFSPFTCGAVYVACFMRIGRRKKPTHTHTHTHTHRGPNIRHYRRRVRPQRHPAHRHRLHGGKWRRAGKESREAVHGWRCSPSLLLPRAALFDDSAFSFLDLALLTSPADPHRHHCLPAHLRVSGHNCRSCPCDVPRLAQFVCPAASACAAMPTCRCNCIKMAAS